MDADNTLRVACHKAQCVSPFRRLILTMLFIVAVPFMLIISSPVHAEVTSQQAYKNCMTDIALAQSLASPGVIQGYFVSSSCIWYQSYPNFGLYYITTNGQGNIPCSGVSSYIFSNQIQNDCGAASAYKPPSATYNPVKNLGDGGTCAGTCSGGVGEGEASGASGSGGGAAILSSAHAPQMVGDPINAATGGTYLQDDDYVDPSGWIVPSL